MDHSHTLPAVAGDTLWLDTTTIRKPASGSRGRSRSTKACRGPLTNRTIPVTSGKHPLRSLPGIIWDIAEIPVSCRSGSDVIIATSIDIGFGEHFANPVRVTTDTTNKQIDQPIATANPQNHEMWVWWQRNSGTEAF